MQSELTSISLTAVPFLNTTDASRLQMISKYIGGQSLPYITNEIPKIIPVDSYKLSIFSDGRYIKFAEDNGIVLYKDEQILIVYYTTKNQLKIYEIPEYKHLYSYFATKLRYVINESKFKKGDILYEYAGFVNGIPTSGYNVHVGFLSIKNYNYEDAIIVSESFAKKAKSYVIQRIFVPVYKNTKIHRNSHDKYLPEVNEIYDLNDVVLNLTNGNENNDYTIQNFFGVNLEQRSYKNELIKAKVFQVNVYKYNKSSDVNDNLTRTILNRKFQEYLINANKKYKKLQEIFGNNNEFVKNIIRKYYLWTKQKYKNIPNIQQLVYIIEIILVYEEPLMQGDKLTTRGANKGVISTIVPDEIMPKTIDGKPLDVIISTFAIPSRMNINQIYEAYLSNLVYYAENKVAKDNDIDLCLNIVYDVAEKFGTTYFEQTKKYLEEIRSNNNIRNRFISDIENYGLYIIVDNFKDKKYTKKDILKIYHKYGLKEFSEIIVNPYKLNKFLGLETKWVVNRDITLNVFTGYLYMYKLFKLARYIVNARNIGVYHSIHKLPLRGRKKKGGSRIGNNEIDALLAFDSFYVLKEFITVKADDHENKQKLIESILNNKEFSLNKNANRTYTIKNVLALSKALFVDLEEILEEDNK